MMMAIDNNYLRLSKEFVKPGEIISVDGFARGTYFSHYALEWGIGESPTEWYDEGITTGKYL